MSYILKVIIIQALLYVCYKWIFSKTQRHSVNRFFLLAALAISFAIPLVDLPTNENLTPFIEDHSFESWATPSQVLVRLSSPQYSYQGTLWMVTYWLYALIAGLFLARSMANLVLLKRFKNQSEFVKKDRYTLFKTSYSSPFSFFSTVFIPKNLFGTAAFDQVLAHECVHVQQLHSLDRLLLDFAVSLFWFNPFMYLYRNALIEIHEYQADEAVLHRFQDPVSYQEILFSQLTSARYAGVVSHFNFSIIKKRIVMMNKMKDKKSGWIYLIVVPLTLMMVVAFSNRPVMPRMNAGSTIRDLIGPSQGLSLFQFLIEVPDYTPSILPLEKLEMIRVSSGFGMRTNPMTKEKQHHRGMDFPVPIGTKVISPADGMVDFAAEDGKWGIRIIINHGTSYQTGYAHLSKLSVKAGETVKKGQEIGETGDTGQSTAPHLHYEVLEMDGQPLNPELFIKDYQF